MVIVLLLISIGICFFVPIYFNKKEEKRIHTNLMIQKSKTPLFFGEIVDGDEYSFIENLKTKFNIKLISDGGYNFIDFNLFGSNGAKLFIYSNFEIIESIKFKCNNLNVSFDEIKQNFIKEFKQKNYPTPFDNANGGITYEFDKFRLAICPVFRHTFIKNSDCGLKIIIENLENTNNNEKLIKENITNSIKLLV